MENREILFFHQTSFRFIFRSFFFFFVLIFSFKFDNLISDKIGILQ